MKKPFYNKVLYELEQKWREAKTKECQAWVSYCQERDKNEAKPLRS